MSTSSPSGPGTQPSPATRPAFARHESSEDPELSKTPRRAHTFQNGTNTGTPSRSTSSLTASSGSVFESTDNDDAPDVRASVDMGELPIELVSLTDSFIESLSAKVHPTPPNIDTLSRLFQDFYALASTHISTHISTLATRQMRDSSPSASRQSAAERLRAKAASLSSKDKPRRTESEQQMLTAEELADRKRARRALEHKRARLEEAVERRLCEGIYGRIYRHRSTQDEAHDDKLRSKTAALKLVGINLADLGVSFGEPGADDGTDAAISRGEEIEKALEPARNELVLMNEKRYPLGKLNHLKAVHRQIVDVLSLYRPSASADEIMPMMIFTLITLPPEKLNVISDAHFIQNFRWEQKLNGEAAYCLTTLEAAISFLQTVDLSTLRADELPSGPPKLASQPHTPKVETFPPAYAPGLSSATQVSPETTLLTATGGGTKPPPSPSAAGLRVASQAAQRSRRLSDLVNTPARAVNAASDSILTTADQSIKTISNSLGDSYNFLLGKLRDIQAAPDSGKDLVVPKTLDDARKLVSTPPPEDDVSVSGASSLHGPEETADPAAANNKKRHASPSGGTAAAEDRVMSFIGGRKMASRDHSTDSLRSVSSSSRRVASSVLGIAEEAREKVLGTSPSSSSGTGAAAGSGLGNPALVESMRNLGNSLNPMARLSGISMMRGFGRAASTPAPAPAPAKEATVAKPPTDGGDLATAFPDIAPALPPKETPKIAPPIKRFMEIQSPGDLKLGEVLDLLRDYRRLAGALKDMNAFEAK